MQPPPPAGANGATHAQGAAGGEPPEQQGTLNITGVRNAGGEAPETPTTSGYHLIYGEFSKRLMHLGQAQANTPTNACTAPPPSKEPMVIQKKLKGLKCKVLKEQTTGQAETRATGKIGATEDTGATQGARATGKLKAAQKTEAPAQLPLSSNDAKKIKLLDIIQHSQYSFNPEHYHLINARLLKEWTLCYYHGTTPTPKDMETKVSFTTIRPDLFHFGLRASFWQNGSDCEQGILAKVVGTLTFYSRGSDGSKLQPLPGDEHSLPQMFESGVEILHLDNESLVVRTSDGNILGFAQLE